MLKIETVTTGSYKESLQTLLSKFTKDRYKNAHFCFYHFFIPFFIIPLFCILFFIHEFPFIQDA